MECPTVKCEICGEECDGAGAGVHWKVTKHNSWTIILPDLSMRRLRMKIRPGILFGEFVILAGMILAMYIGFQEVALVLAGGICSLLPKLVESEEKTDSS